MSCEDGALGAPKFSRGTFMPAKTGLPPITQRGMGRGLTRSGPACAGLCGMWLRPSHPFRICYRGSAGRSEQLADHTTPDGHSVERALVVYVGAQKCYVTLHRDIARLGHLASPILAYVAPHVICVLIMLPERLATRIRVMLAGARSPC